MGLDILIAGGTTNTLHPPELLGCITEVRVEQSLNEPTRFAIRYIDDIKDGKLTKAGVAQLQLGELVTIAVEREGDYACLCRGPILEHASEVTVGGAGSSFTVSGPDRRDELAREHRDQNWTGLASDVARRLIGDVYSETDVQDTDERYDDNGNALPQRASDLEFLIELAEEHGYHFWIDYENVREAPPSSLSLLEVARWKSSPPLQDSPPLGVPLPLPLVDGDTRLTYNVGRRECQNLTAFTISSDGDRPSAVNASTRNVTDGEHDAVNVQDEAAPIGGTGDGLANRAPARQMSPRPQGNAQTARRRNAAALREAGFFVSAECSTTRHLLRDVLRPHQIVGVDGLGGSNASTPFRVKSVVHVINGNGHYMDAELETNVQIP